MKYRIKMSKSYLILLIAIFLLIVILNFINSSKTIYIDIFGKRIKGSEEIYLKHEGEYYLSFDFVKDNIDDEIYFDNISKKIVISSDVCLLKAKVNDKKITVDFNNQDVKNTAVIEKERIYVSLETIKKAYNIETTICNNTIYIYDNVAFKCKLKTNNIGVYIESNSKNKIVDYVYKKDNISGIFETEKFLFVKINNKKVGYVLKDKLEYTIENVKEEVKVNKKVYIYADSNIQSIEKSLKVDGVLLNMFEMVKQDGSISERNTNEKALSVLKQKNFSVYGIVTNGYNLANFTTSTTTQILSDEAKRLEVINNLSKKIEEYGLEGIVIDFRMIKENDRHNFIQFVKEFEAVTEKDVVVSIDANEYKNYIEIVNYSDYSILNIYDRRNSNSSVAGSVSEIVWFEKVVNETLKIANKDKLIIGIPAYSILWTEKNSSVVNAEIYNLKAIEEYISKNKLEKKYSESVKQNYIEMKKGSLVYRMWIEDEMSINSRIKLIKDKGVLGVAIYKLGYQNDMIVNIANTIK